MPPEATTAPAGTGAGLDTKQVAANLTRGITDKATGKGPEKPGGTDKAETVVDPNAGKKKYVVEGKERWLSPQEADSYVQKGIAFEPRISEIARMKHEMQQFEQTLLDNPGAILANIAKKKNVPVSQLVQNVLDSNASDEVKEATGKWYWEKVAKLHQMDPKDRQIFEQDEKIKTLEAKDKEKAEMAVALENRSKVVHALGQVSSQIQETLKELGINNPNSSVAIRLTKEIADVMRVSYLTKQPCTAKIAADKVKTRIRDYQKQFYDDLDPDALVEAIGKENAEKVRKHFLKAVQDVEKGSEPKAGTHFTKPPKRNERETMNLDQFHDYLDDLKKNSK